MTYNEFQSACADVRKTEGFPETETGKKVLPYITGKMGLIKTLDETQQQWISRCWKLYKQQ